MAQNYRCRLGEIDIVARNREYLIICEVKTRTGRSAGHPLEAITPKKSARVRKLGEFYWSFETDRKLQLRFDVIAVLPTISGAKIEHLTDAF